MLRLLLATGSLLAGSLVAQNYTLYQDVVVPAPVPQTGNKEVYDLAVPNTHPTPMPLIIAFHGLYGNNHASVRDAVFAPNGWDLFTDAAAAGCAVLVPRGGSEGDFPFTTTVVTYGRRSMHYHVDAAVADVMANHAIDPQRVYGYGFSMGGNDAVDYAARHLDPSQGVMLAAVVTHSGALSRPYAYHQSSPSAQAALARLYGVASYASDPLAFQEANTVDYVSQLLPDTSLGWNLTHVPIAQYYDNDNVLPNDNAIAVKENELFTDLMQNVIGHPALTVANTAGNGHYYATLPTSTILASFQGTLAIPTRGRLLVPKPLAGNVQRMFHFVVGRDLSSNVMAGFRYWHVGQNLRLDDVDQLVLVRVEINDLGASTTQSLFVDVTTVAGQMFLLRLSDYGMPASNVLDNGVPLAASQWGYDVGDGSVWIIAQHGMQLEIQP